MGIARRVFWLALVFISLLTSIDGHSFGADDRPNILFAIADDWGWPHAGAYGDPVVQTPTFDRIAREGVLFENAFVSSPSCTPSRNAILTGQYHWRLGSGANLWSRLDSRFATYPLLLEDAGYFVGHYRKSWGPGRLDNWDRHPAGPKFDSFEQFLQQRPGGTPFCFWFGAFDPHRGYDPGSGKRSGMDLSRIRLWAHFPDNEVVRSDVADYYFEVQRFDRELGAALELLESIGELDRTIVVVTGDHGMPFPRCKANLYDCGTHVPMAVRWPDKIPGGRRIDDFVSTVDLAPTFLDVAGVEIPDAMTGTSWRPLLESDRSGRIDPDRHFVVTGKERHVPCQETPITGGTPMRAIRSDDFLLIQNFEPDRWPAGTPHYDRATIPGAWLADCDNGPTKTWIAERRDDDPQAERAWQWCFAKRPALELYDLKADPEQLTNVAGDPAYREVRDSLQQQMHAFLRRTGDPRITGEGVDVFETTEYFGRGPRHPDYRPAKK